MLGRREFERCCVETLFAVWQVHSQPTAAGRPTATLGHPLPRGSGAPAAAGRPTAALRRRRRGGGLKRVWGAHQPPRKARRKPPSASPCVGSRPASRRAAREGGRCVPGAHLGGARRGSRRQARARRRRRARRPPGLSLSRARARARSSFSLSLARARGGGARAGGSRGGPAPVRTTGVASGSLPPFRPTRPTSRRARAVGWRAARRL